MPDFNPGPASTSTPNTQEALSTVSVVPTGVVLPGVTNYANLPSPSTVQIGTIAYTNDQGVVYNNGVTWSTRLSTLPNYISRPPLSVGVVGTSESLAAPNLDLFGKTTAPYNWNAVQRQVSIAHPLVQGMLRSGGSWYLADFTYPYSGATSEQVLAVCPPAMFGNPYVGLPDACIIEASENDVGQIGASGYTFARSISAHKSLINAVQGAGIQPILQGQFPHNTYPVVAEQMNWTLLQMAKEFGIPFINTWEAMVNPANGQWQSNLSSDGIHGSNTAGHVLGYLFNQVIMGWFRLSPRASVALWDSAANWHNQDPNFQTFSGTVNQPNSFPNASGWNMLGSTTALCTMTNSSGSEPGGGHTMIQPTPNIVQGLNQANIPNYVGNAVCCAGDGNAAHYMGPQLTLPSGGFGTLTAGMKLAMAFRIKYLSASGQANPNQGYSQLYYQGATITVPMLGLSSPAAFGTSFGCQIGGEALYPAGDYYGEYTITPALFTTNGAQIAAPYYGFTLYNGSGSNVGDAICIANLRIVNLSAVNPAIVTP